MYNLLTNIPSHIGLLFYAGFLILSFGLIGYGAYKHIFREEYASSFFLCVDFGSGSSCEKFTKLTLTILS